MWWCVCETQIVVMQNAPWFSKYVERSVPHGGGNHAQLYLM